jgi:hypothetical protein
MKLASYRPRNPALPRRQDYYNPQRAGYPTIPFQPIPVIGGQAVNHSPYPARDFPELPRADTPPVQCPQGSTWSPYDRRCAVNTPQYRGLGNLRVYSGYGKYISRDVGKKWEWDSFGVGLGAMAITASMGIAASLIMTRGSKGTVTGQVAPALIPAVGAGIIAYLLRWHTNNLCNCNGADPERSFQSTEMATLEQVAQTLKTPTCRPGYIYVASRGECVPDLI